MAQGGGTPEWFSIQNQQNNQYNPFNDRKYDQESTLQETRDRARTWLSENLITYHLEVMAMGRVL